MIIFLSDISFNVDMLNECIDDFVSVDKKSFLNNQIKKRLYKYNQMKSNEFDELIDKLTTNIDNCCSIDVLRVGITHLSRLSRNYYNSYTKVCDNIWSDL